MEIYLAIIFGALVGIGWELHHIRKGLDRWHKQWMGCDPDFIKMISRQAVDTFRHRQREDGES